MSRFANQCWSIAPFLGLVAFAALFVWFSSRGLPNVVASHFGASGQANGFMPREVYVWFMLAIVVLVPLVLAVLPMRMFSNSKARINLPNRDYWMAPERRAETIEILSRQAVRFSTMLMAFLCYVHWLVIQANQTVPPTLSSQWFVSGLVVFLVGTLFWVVTLIGRFRNVPR